MEPVADAMTRIDHRKLLRFVSASFEKLGVSHEDAKVAANALVAADLRGVDTHGVIRFSPNAWYVKWLLVGSMNP
jgi:L-2-hydroxycarboxylate dehydrogenase (NAD+)